MEGDTHTGLLWRINKDALGARRVADAVNPMPKRRRHLRLNGRQQQMMTGRAISRDGERA